VAPHHRIRRGAGAWLTLLFLLGVMGIVLGQQDDPSEIFLKAYLSAQQGEKLEHENRFKTALAKYRFAGSLIETLRRSHTDWQPAVVEYRGRKISEGILRIQGRMSTQNQLTTSAGRLPEVAPLLPDSDGWSEPGPEIVARNPARTSVRRPATPRSKRRQENCAVKSMNCKRHSEKRGPTSKLHGKKKTPSTRV